MSVSPSSPDSAVFLVSGAARGLGREIARAALQAGHRVVAGARRESALDDLAREYGERIAVVPLEVTDGRAAQAAVATAVSRFGPAGRPGQQRRLCQRRRHRRHGLRGLPGPGGHQPARRGPADPGGAAGHARAAVRADHPGLLGRRPDGDAGAGRLPVGQVGRRRVLLGPGRRGGAAGHQGDGPGARRDADRLGRARPCGWTRSGPSTPRPWAGWRPCTPAGAPPRPATRSR